MLRLCYRLLPAAFLLTNAPAAWAQTNAPVAQIAEVEFPSGVVSSVSASSVGFVDLPKTLLPVLAPKPFLSDKSLRFVGEPLSYTITVHDKSLSASISGTRVTFVPDGEALPKASLQPTAESSEFGEKSASAGYVRYGVAYLVSIACEKESDKRCASADYAKALLASVDLIGGGRQAPGPDAAPRSSAPAPSNSAAPPMVAAAALPADFASPAGHLISGSGSGVKSEIVYAPNLRFPLEGRPAFLNSQVYSIGGKHGPAGGWSDPKNYAYPWRDNFCEARPYKTTMCPSGQGHQGQDIRPAKANKPNQPTYWAVAVEDGKITRDQRWITVLTGASGRQYYYLHLKRLPDVAKVGEVVKRGQKLGYVSNEFGGTPTPVHLHFEIRQNIAGKGLVPVPPYTSLIEAYKAM